MSLAERWWYALKPASWPKVFVPALLGQAVGAVYSGRPSAAALAFGLLWMVADVAFIVLLNDWGDRAVDALKRRMFPQAGSPKTIPDGILPAEALLAAGLGAGAVALLLAGGAGAALERPLLLPLAALSLGIFIAYTLPPLRLNYRGGGELLEMVGVGGVLPALHAYAQCGQWAPPLLVALAPGLLALALSSALASGLSDEESDRAGGKRTWASTFGKRLGSPGLGGPAGPWRAALAGGALGGPWRGLGPLPSSPPRGWCWALASGPGGAARPR